MVADYLHKYGQVKAMRENDWTASQFREIFGKNYLSDLYIRKFAIEWETDYCEDGRTEQSGTAYIEAETLREAIKKFKKTAAHHAAIISVKEIRRDNND